MRIYTHKYCIVIRSNLIEKVYFFETFSYHLNSKSFHNLNQRLCALEFSKCKSQFSQTDSRQIGTKTENCKTICSLVTQIHVNVNVYCILSHFRIQKVMNFQNISSNENVKMVH